MPAVLVWGDRVWDPLYWAILAGLGPALIYVLLRQLREHFGSLRSVRDDLALTALFAGTNFVWTAAASAAQPVFTAGRTKSQVALATARRDDR